MSCSTCERRRTPCDESRPRCSTCARVHLKCVYIIPPKISFLDETDVVTGRVPPSKRRKLGAVEHAEQQQIDEGNSESHPLGVPENIQEHHDQLNFQMGQEWATSYDMMPNPDFAASDFAAWDQNFYAELLANTSPGQMLPLPGLSPDSLDLHGSFLPPQNPPKELTSVATNPHNPPNLSCIEPVRGNGENGVNPNPRVEDSSEVPEHVLAQHYSLNAIHRPDSKNWNFYMHFYNRFATTHPPVLSAIYASASAQLLYANKLGSMARAISHYDNCYTKLGELYGIFIPDELNPVENESFLNSLRNMKQEGLDVVIISFYFLALFDLTTSRPVKLRRILRVMPDIIRLQKRNEQSGTFQRLSTWFLYLDVRASLFGLGDNNTAIYSFGDEPELAEAVSASQNVLQEEYRFLYPEEERARDKLSVPLILRILEIMVIFREIAKHTETADDMVKSLIQQKIDHQKKELASIDEKSTKKAKLGIYYHTIVALYNAAEIYYSRTFHPELPLYSANTHAVAILTVTEKMHRTLGKPQAATPHSKAWPIPLILATIEVSDPIHRSWGLRKFHDYRRAGSHYVKSYAFVEKICAVEESSGKRVNLGDVMKGMGEEFIV